ncbi:MAG: hypothetical protein ACKVP7_14075 [Hyphomicrobiaceae bacterium]
MLFQTMRAAVGASLVAVARQLGTTTDVILALEGCNPGGLPLWPETSRIVLAYGAWLEMDVRPALARLRQIMDGMVIESAHRPAPPVPSATPPQAMLVSRTEPVASISSGRSPAAGARQSTSLAAALIAVQEPPLRRDLSSNGPRPVAPVRSDRVPSGRSAGLVTAVSLGLANRLSRKRFRLSMPRLTRRTAMLVGLPVGFLLATVLAMAMLPTGLQSGLGILPDGLARSLSVRLDNTTRRIVVGPDGMKWIVVADPRSRKADRMATPGRH